MARVREKKNITEMADLLVLPDQRKACRIGQASAEKLIGPAEKERVASVPKREQLASKPDPPLTKVKGTEPSVQITRS